METKTIPFDLETAKKIQAGEIAGRITTKDGKDVRIICTDKASTDGDNKTQIVCLIRFGTEEFVSVNDPKTGVCWDIEDNGRQQDIVLEVSDIKPQFKPFDKVLVRDDSDTKWRPLFYCYYNKENDPYFHICSDGCGWKQCIPYEGNEHLVGTTDKPNT